LSGLRREFRTGGLAVGRKPMLVLSRKKNESIVVNDNIVITVVDVRGDKVRIGIEAPRDVSVHRQEVLEAILSEKLKFSSPRSEESSDVTIQ
jgi:carbon storage regulator